MTASNRAVQSAIIAANAAREKLGLDVVAFDVSDQLGIAELFLVIGAANERQAKAIADEVERQLTAIKEKPARVEGLREGRWVLLDYFDLIVHVQQIDERNYYDLERLWRDCPRIELPIEDLPLPIGA
ncbi:MAG TPA: ribosome silencing factor [Candidatus Nanopelagicaceae bacterium]|nr:ribosome silencing factor [Candidatus Nanopelagicaceae bacterium]